MCCLSHPFVCITGFLFSIFQFCRHWTESKKKEILKIKRDEGRKDDKMGLSRFWRCTRSSPWKWKYKKTKTRRLRKGGNWVQQTTGHGVSWHFSLFFPFFPFSLHFRFVNQDKSNLPDGIQETDAQFDVKIMAIYFCVFISRRKQKQTHTHTLHSL